MTERNDLCPCGSGRKYKRCCMKDFAKGPKRLVHIKPAPASAPVRAREPHNVAIWQSEVNAAMAIMQMMRRGGGLR